MVYRYKSKEGTVAVRGLRFDQNWRNSNIRLPFSSEEESLLDIQEAESCDLFTDSAPVSVVKESEKKSSEKSSNKKSEKTPKESKEDKEDADKEDMEKVAPPTEDASSESNN